MTGTGNRVWGWEGEWDGDRESAGMGMARGMGMGTGVGVGMGRDWGQAVGTGQDGQDERHGGGREMHGRVM